ncbi:sorbin and SH3 domain-containing protein 1-like [Culicoides brevitarsis]|uniref:sorbin and SH3 domain-containing protein 1-like n=1 Tax=Culicoides brevitarsis TaxID=469753 RepID=UPI00307B2D80
MQQQKDSEGAFIPYPVWMPPHSPSAKKKEFQPIHFKVPSSRIPVTKQPANGEGNLSRILAAGTNQPQFTIERPETSTLAEEDPLEKKDKYLKLQSGGDAPFYGFRTTVPVVEGSAKKYHKSNINIHYETPVLLEEKEFIPENVLAHQQANHMIKVYEETRKSKALKEKAANESRRHTDNFTASQKAPSLMLHRYDDDNIMNTVNYKVAKAVHDFTGYNKNELSFKKGDILMLYKKVDHNWYEGQLCGKRGLVPFSYVEVLSKPAKKEYTNMSNAVAKFNFKAESKVELNLNKGDIVQIIRRIDQNWFEGQIDDRKGIFPCSYVYVFNEDELESNNVDVRSYKTVAEQPQPVMQCQTVVHHHDTSDDATYRVLYSYKPKNADELELREGDIVHVLETCDDGWFIGAVGNRFGTFPGNYVEKL